MAPDNASFVEWPRIRARMVALEHDIGNLELSIARNGNDQVTLNRLTIALYNARDELHELRSLLAEVESLRASEGSIQLSSSAILVAILVMLAAIVLVAAYAIGIR